MTFKAEQELARSWRERQGSDGERSQGYVVIFNASVAGWKRELDNPQGWEPGCLAVGPEGEVFQAVGGNGYDGAQAWQAQTSISIKADPSSCADNNIFPRFGLGSVLTNRAAPVPLIVTDQDHLLTELEARLANEMRDLVSSLLQFGCRTQTIGIELPHSSHYGKLVTAAFGAFSLQLANALLQVRDTPLLIGDGAEHLAKLGLRLDDLFREVNLDGRNFLAVALIDSSTSQVANGVK